ncbi:hypothetical protein H310_02007 [Aphanomyces invadans]|uniref:Uncharacterized protein n=1 Tax=Aphanomyces invadans TaxID=157072 RepID=A0A024UPG5_9STRA|nr:hypothetical protein H310_02007 [Aphanomyces invadans]ETW07503.1 hypothetical protein H310_02007 [Aphanomyces invadans]|eukprot:XP_008863596.1 hypothetical protein H310_02007 [Aphanomyces invadans]
MEAPRTDRLLDAPDDEDWTADPCIRESYDAFHVLAIPSTYTAFPDASSPDGSRVGTWEYLVQHCATGFMDIYAAAYIFWIHLMSIETILVVVVAGVTTSGYYYIGMQANGTSFGANLSWTLVTFAIISPMIMQIRQAFTRRETALDAIAELKAITSNVLMANAIWDWGKNERVKLAPDHALRTKRILKGIASDVRRVLMLPTFTRGRHRFTTSGMDEAKEFTHAFHYLCRRITFSTTLLHRQVELMKAAGLPANEASRINQYHWFIQARIEKLCNIKLYRTPQATRSFTRLCILVLPLFYGPYYVYIATTGTSVHTNFAFALTLSLATSLIMIGIFNVEKALEDPFTEEGLDGVKVERAMQRIMDALDVILPSSEPPSKPCL